MTVRREIVQSPSETGTRSREGGILEIVCRPTERRARLPGRRIDRVQACRSGESAIAAETFMNNAGSLTRWPRSGKPFHMMRQFRLLFLLLAWIPTVFSCVSESREGLPPGSPFAESVAPVAAIGTNPLPQGIAVGDVTSQSPLLWFRSEAPGAAQL